MASALTWTGCGTTYSVTMSDYEGNNKYDYAGAMTVFNGERTLGTLSADQRSFDATLPYNAPRDSRGMPRISVLVDTPCGKQKATATAFTERSKEKSKLLISHDLTPPDVLHFWYDNRNHGPSNVTVGSLQVPMPGNDTGHFLIPFAGCSGAIQVTVESVSAGAINLAPEAMDTAFVIDPSASHCYVQNLNHYSESAAPEDASPTFFSGDRFYQSRGRIDSFLQPPPKWIQSPTGFGTLLSWEDFDAWSGKSDLLRDRCHPSTAISK